MIESFKQIPEKQIEVLSRVREMLDFKQKILSCACCGESYCEKRDLLPDGSKMIGFQWKLKDLSRLKLSPADKIAHEAINPYYRRVYSRFPTTPSDVFGKFISSNVF